MEETRFKAKQRPSKYFSVKQKHELIKAYLESGKSKREIWQEFTGEPKEKGQIIKYMRQLGYLEKDATRKPITFYMKKKSASSPAAKKQPDKFQSDNVEELKAEIEQLRLREQFYITLIETAEQELKIDIRKKSYTK